MLFKKISEYRESMVRFLSRFISIAKGLMPKLPSIGWVLCGDDNFGSSRIHGGNVHQYLLSVGVDSRVLSSPAKANYELDLGLIKMVSIAFSRFDVIVFQKVFGYSAIRFSRYLRLLGKRTVLVLCDLQESEMIRAVDHVIVTSEFLANEVRSKYGVSPTVIDDAIEVPSDFSKIEGSGVSRFVPRVVWVGSRDNWSGIAALMELMSNSDLNGRLELITVSDHPDASISWSAEAVIDVCRIVDFAVLPTGRSNWVKSKSTNRLSMFLAMGLPVIAEPIPSYEDLVRKTGGVIWATDNISWLCGIERMLDSQYRADLVGGVNRKVRALLDMSVIGPHWLETFQSVVGDQK